VAWWRFEEGQGGTTVDSAENHEDELRGHLSFAAGVRGKGLKFDGFTARVVRNASTAPRLTGAFTIEAWIAPQEYSWNWTGIVDHDQGLGRVTSSGSTIWADWFPCGGRQAMAGLLEQGSGAALEVVPRGRDFDPRQGFAVFINGQLAAVSRHMGNSIRPTTWTCSSACLTATSHPP